MEQLGNFYARFPALDWVIAVLVSVFVWKFLPGGVLEAMAVEGPGLSLGTSALAGFLLTAGTFAFTMAYSSRSSTMIFLRSTRPREHGRNWVSALAALTVGAIVSLIAAALWPISHLVAMSMTAGSIALLAMVAGRVLWWITYVMQSEVGDIEATQAGVTRLPRSTEARH